MKSFGRLFSRSRNNSGSKVRKAAITRRLRSETLEKRQLLAGDFLSHHNYLVAQDTNRDFAINPMDALTVINAMNKYGTGSVDRLPVSEKSAMVDVTADGYLTPMDALQVINALNRGESVDTLVELRLDVREHLDNAVNPADPSNPPIEPSLLAAGSRTMTVGVGDIVDLEISYEDQRRLGGDIGAFTVFADLFTPNANITFADYVEPIVTETQELVFSDDLINAEGGTIVFSMENRPSFTVDTGDFLDDATGEISNALRSFGFTQTASDGTTELDQFQVRRLPRGDEPDAPFEFRIRFLGDALANQQIPNVQIDVSAVTSSEANFNLTANVLEVPAINPDGSVNGNAIPFNINTHSRTWQNNSNFYNLSTGGTFTSEGYDEVGGVGQILSNGINPFPEPFDAFSLPIRIIQPIQNLVIQLDPPDTPAAAILLYPGSEGDAISSDMIEIDTTDDPSIAGDDRFGLVVFNAVEGTLVADTGTITLNEDLVPFDDNTIGNTIDLLDLVEDIADPNANISIDSVTNGSIGSVTLNGSVATYVPDDDVSGSDSFTFTASSGSNTVTGTVEVTINPVNDPPTANNDAINASQGTVRTIQPDELTGNDNAGPADEDQTLTIASVSAISGSNGTNGTVSLNTDGTVSYTPANGFSGTARFNYTVRDSDGLTATAQVTVTVAEVNTPPTANPDTLTTEEDTPLTFTANELLANDNDNGAITFEGLTENLNPATQGTITDNGGGSFTYAPPNNLFGNGLATFTYTISDGEFEDTATVTINVTPVNDDPVANDDTLSVDEFATSTLDVLANDNPGPNESSQTIVITGISTTGTAGEATIINNGQNIAFTPSQSAPSQTTLSYTIEDSEGATATATVTINVVPVVRPRAINDSETVAEDSGLVNIDVLANDLANAGQQVTLETIGAEIQGDAQVLINNNGTATKTDDTIDVTPADDFFGTITFTYTIKDTGIDGDVEDPAAATGTVTVNVTPVNDPPEFVPDANRVTPEDTELTVDGDALLANDNVGADNETNQTLRISAVNATSQQGGTVTLDSGDIRYSPPLNFNGNDVITYTIADGTGEDAENAQGTLTVTVTPVNDPPVPGSPSFDATEDTVRTLTRTQVLAGSAPGPATGTPEAGQTLSVTGSVGGTSEAGGSVNVAANGSVTYVPPAHFFGEDSFVLTIRDNGTPAESANLTVSLNVAPVNDPPVAGNDSVIAFQNSVATFSQGQLLANDRPGPADVPAPFDESAQTLTITAVRALSGTQGQVSLNANGSIRFEPTADFKGETSFEYTVSDGEITDTAIVTVNVQEFQPSSISGSVFFDKIASLTNPVRNGVQDADESGLSGATVTLNSDANQNVTGQAISKTVLTKLGGSFEFNNLPPGTFRVNFNLPSLVMDGRDFAGSLGDADSANNQFTVNIAQPGGFTADNYRFTVAGLTGAASETGSILAIDFLKDNPDANDDSDGGRRGGTAGLDADGQMTFFKARDGLDDARFVEVAVNEDKDEVLLSYIDKTTNIVRSARLNESQFLLIPDGEGGAVLRIFGGLDNFAFANSAEELLNQEFANYRDAIDRIMAEEA